MEWEGVRNGRREAGGRIGDSKRGGMGAEEG